MTSLEKFFSNAKYFQEKLLMEGKIGFCMPKNGLDSLFRGIVDLLIYRKPIVLSHWRYAIHQKSDHQKQVAAQ